MLRSIRNVKLLKCVSLICLSPLFVFYSSLNIGWLSKCKTNFFSTQMKTALISIILVLRSGLFNNCTWSAVFDNVLYYTLMWLQGDRSSAVEFYSTSYTFEVSRVTRHRRRDNIGACHS